MQEAFRRIYSRGKHLNDRLAESDRLYRVHSFLDSLMLPVLVALLAVLYLEFFAHLSHRQHVWLLRVEKVILGYFVLEILVDFTLYKKNREFFRHKWVDILLVLPFFAVLKSLRGLKLLKFLKPAKPAKAAKAGKAVKTGKAAHAGKTTHGFKLASQGKKAQHFTKFVKKSWEKTVGKMLD